MLERIKSKLFEGPTIWVAIFLMLEMCFFANLGISVYLFRKTNEFAKVHTLHILSGTACILVFVLLCYCLFKYYKLNGGGMSFLDFVIRKRYIICGTLFLYALVFKLNGFSFSMWDSYINTTNGINVIFGVRRDITSDTWALALPAIFNQIDNNFPLYNFDIMQKGVNALIMGLPVWDITLLGKPFMWGYVLFGKNVGMAWHFSLKFFTLLLSSYEVCNYLNGGKRKASAVFALVITFASPIMWWFGQTIIDAFIFFQVCVASLVGYFKCQKGVWRKIALAVVLTISGVSFVTVLYPALQVPLGFLFLLLAISIFYNGIKEVGWKRSDTLVLLGCATVVIGIVARFVLLCRNDIQLLSETVYPGARVMTGGGFDMKTLYYFFMQWLLPVKSATMSNNCELSFFIPLLPAILFIFPFVIQRTKRKLHLALYLYEIWLISWIFVSYPSLVGKLTLFSYVTENRLTMVVGLVGVYLTVIALGNTPVKELYNKKIASTILGLNILLMLMVFAISNGGGYLDFLGTAKFIPIILSIVAFSAFYFVFVFGYEKPMYVLLVLCTLVCGATVNPISLGSGSFFTNPLAEKINQIEYAEPSAYWIINESFPYSDYLLGQGVKSFNAHNPYGDKEKWKLLDPDGKFNEITNRYAHISVKIDETEGGIGLLAPDAIYVQLNKSHLQNLHITYVLSRAELSKEYAEIYYDPISKFRIYKLN